MAHINLDGASLIATPIREIEEGKWLMRAEQHGPRCVPGTPIVVRTSEIEEMAAAEMPDDGQAALNKALAEERARIPAPETYLKGVKTIPES